MVRELHRRNLLDDFREVLASQAALQELVKRDLRSRYKRSALGLVWTMLHPLLMMAVTGFIFSELFQFTIRHFSLYMLSAYVVWIFFAQGTVAALNSLRAGAGLSRKVYLPPALFPLAAVNAAAVNLVLSLVPLFLVRLASGGHLTWSLLFVPVAVVLALLFAYGVGLLLAAASVFFHDLVHLYQVLLLAWMYLTPIFYPLDIIPANRVWVFHLNPLYHLTQIFRDPIYDGLWPQPINVAFAAGFALAAAGLGWLFFERSRDAFSAYL